MPGGKPSFKLSRFTFAIDNPDICTKSLLNTLRTLPQSSAQPKFIVITAYGATKAERASVPLPLKPLYPLLNDAHADKLGVERIIHYSAGWTPEWHEPRGPAETILAPGWEDTLPGPKGWLKHAVILRPGIFKEGEATGKYRVGEKLTGVWSITREDIAHFIVGDLVKDWDKYENKAIDIAY